MAISVPNPRPPEPTPEPEVPRKTPREEKIDRICSMFTLRTSDTLRLREVLEEEL